MGEADAPIIDELPPGLGHLPARSSRRRAAREQNLRHGRGLRYSRVGTTSCSAAQVAVQPKAIDADKPPRPSASARHRPDDPTHYGEPSRASASIRGTTAAGANPQVNRPHLYVGPRRCTPPSKRAASSSTRPARFATTYVWHSVTRIVLSEI